MSNYMAGVCMSEHNMRLMTTEGMWLTSQRDMLNKRVWQCNDLYKMPRVNMIKMVNTGMICPIMMLWRYTWFDQGNKTWWVCSMSLIQEINDMYYYDVIRTPRTRHKRRHPLIECAQHDFNIIYFSFLYFIFLGLTRGLPLLLCILRCDEEFRPT